jgi:hypothetical protein
MSLGTDEETVRMWYEGKDDLRITYHGLTAQIGASHYQFVAYKRYCEPLAF